MPLETPLIGQHKSSGAAFGEYFGMHLPAHFGDFAGEYHAAKESVAVADMNYKAFFSFSGPDRQRYVNAVLTSNVRDLQPGQGAVGLLLTPQGHILAEVETYLFVSNILAASHAMVRERTFATFDKFIIMDDVTLEDLTSSTGTLALLGPRAAELILGATGVDIAGMAEFAHFETAIKSGSGAIPCRVIRRAIATPPNAVAASALVIVAREHITAVWEELERCVRALGGRPAGMEALNSLRLESGIAWFGHDYDDKQIPHEAGLENSHISYEKGCYTGQEIVERVRSRGHANRRLTELQFLADVPPAPGTKLVVIPTAEGAAPTEAGIVTSAAFSPILKKPIGLGYLRREHSSIGSRLDAAGVAAEVISPPALAGKSST